MFEYWYVLVIDMLELLTCSRYWYVRFIDMFELLICSSYWRVRVIDILTHKRTVKIMLRLCRLTWVLTVRRCNKTLRLPVVVGNITVYTWFIYVFHTYTDWWSWSAFGCYYCWVLGSAASPLEDAWDQIASPLKIAGDLDVSWIKKTFIY